MPIGFQIGATSIGIALLPGLIGVLVERVGAQTIPPALLVIAVLITVLYEISLRSAQTVRQAEAVPAVTD
jgi:fucose permease